MTNVLVDYKPFSWTDHVPFTNLVNVVQKLEGTPGAFDPSFMGEWLRLPGRDPEANCLLAYNGDTLLGYILVNQEGPIKRAVLEGGVLPAHRRKGIGTQLFNWALERGRQAGASIAHVAASEEDTEQNVFLERRGFSLVRHHEQMRWNGDGIPEPNLPPVFVFRPFRFGDEAGLTGVQNAAFSTQWGFSPNTVEQISHIVHMSRSDPEGVVLLLADEEVVGYCWTQTAGEAPQEVGYISMIGVHPKHQGKGLGRAALIYGIRSLLQRDIRIVELTVDRENTAAKKLYTSFGFVKMSGQKWYETTLMDG